MSGNVVNATRTTEANAEVAPPSVTATESHDSSLQEGQETSHPLLTALFIFSFPFSNGQSS